MTPVTRKTERRERERECPHTPLIPEDKNPVLEAIDDKLLSVLFSNFLFLVVISFCCPQTSGLLYTSA